MTTDEMILALVERHGFKLPDGYTITYGGRGFKDTWSDEWVNRHDLNRKRFHDLCAMEFARQALLAERDAMRAVVEAAKKCQPALEAHAEEYSYYEDYNALDAALRDLETKEAEDA